MARSTSTHGLKQAVLHVLEKGLDAITAAGPVAWISVVAIAALCAMVCVVYIMSGGAGLAR